MRSPERSAIITTDEERFWIRYHEERALFSFRLDDDTELRFKLNRWRYAAPPGTRGVGLFKSDLALRRRELYGRRNGSMTIL